MFVVAKLEEARDKNPRFGEESALRSEMIKLCGYYIKLRVRPGLLKAHFYRQAITERAWIENQLTHVHWENPHLF